MRVNGGEQLQGLYNLIQPHTHTYVAVMAVSVENTSTAAAWGHMTSHITCPGQEKKNVKVHSSLCVAAS